MKPSLRIAFLALFLLNLGDITASYGQCDTFFTTNAGVNNCGGGTMFDIKAKCEPLDIYAFSALFNTTNTQQVRIYYKKGTYFGNETDSTVWTLLDAFTMTPTSTTALTYLSLNDTLTIQPTVTYGIYINYTSFYTTGGNSYSTADLELTAGAGLCGKFSGFNSGRTFNGEVFYCPTVKANNDAGLYSFVSPVNFCAGTKDIKVAVKNFGKNKITSLKLNWSVNGVAQTPVTYSGTLDTVGCPGLTVDTVTLGSYAFSNSTKIDLKVWTSDPNNSADPINNNDTITATLKPALSGNYTIGGSSPNFSSINAAINELKEFGVCGPVTLDIRSGTYTERLVIIEIPGASATNTITFRGASRTGTIIQNTATSGNDQQTILLNGADHVIFKNMTIKANNTTWAVGVHFSASADSNMVDSCDIILSTTATGGGLFGIVVSGSTTNPVSNSGDKGEYNTISNNKIIGGYYGIFLIGGSTTDYIWGNKMLNNEITDFYYAGIQYQYGGSTNIIGNKISHTRNTGTTYGINALYFTDYNISGNYIYTSYYGLIIDFGNANLYNSSFGRSEVATNMVISTNTTGTALRLGTVSNTDVFHNSTLAAGNYAADVQNVSLSNIMNNIFVNTKSSTGTFAFFGNNNTFSSTYQLNYNLYYAPNASTPISWNGTTYSTVSGWFSAITTINTKSLSGDPGYLSATDLRLSSSTSKPIGANVAISEDIDGNPRCPDFPVMGAHEPERHFQGSPSKPLGICVGSTGTFELEPPRGLANSDYGTKWTISSLTFATAKGSQTLNYSVSAPTSTTNGKFTFSPKSTDADSTYILRIYISNTGSPGCDSTIEEYLKGITPPTANFSMSSTKICLSSAVTFTNTGTKSPVTTYKWYMGNGSIKTDTSFNYTYPNPGTYTVSLVTSIEGCTDSTAKTITIDGSVSGASFKQGATFQGYFFNGTPNDPDLACVRDTLTYEIVPPPAFTNGDYGTKWEVSAHSIKSAGGASSSAYTFNSPSSSGPGSIVFRPTFAEADLTFIISTTLKPLNSACTKDTTLVRYVAVSTSPTADFSIKGQCAGEPTFFTDASVVAPGLVVRKYEFGVGNAFATTANPNYTYTTAGEYTVTYTVTGKGGCDDILKKKITIYDQPTADFDVPSTVCAGNPAAFMSTSTGNGTTITRYKWTFNQGTTPDTSDQANVSYTFANPGPYTATLQVWTDGGCNSSVTKNITVVDAPTAAFPLTKGCINEPITFVNNSLDAVSYEWRFSDKDTIRTKDAVKTFKFASSYSVTLVATSASGCRDSVTRQIDFHDQPEVDFTSTGNCAGRVVNFQDATTFPTPSSSAVEWTWTIEGQKKTGDKTTHTFATAGTYNVKLKVKSNNGCSDSFTAPIIINPAPVAGMTLPGSACVNVASTFENTSTGTGNSYLWHFGDGETSTDEKPSHTYAATGTYIVKLVTTNGTGCKDSVTEQLTVGLGPEVPFAWCAKDKGKVVTFKADTPSYASYEWDFGDILGGTGTGPNPTYTYLAATGEYTVTLTVTDAAGCVGTYSATVGTGDKDNSTNCIIGIESMAAGMLNMNIYPNPFSYQTRIEYKLLKSQQVRVSVWDATGKEVAVLNNGLQQAGKQQLMLDANEHKLSAGLYMIRIETEGAVSSSQVVRLE